MVVLGFGVLYSVYELGYVQNDMLSVKEAGGMTHRPQFDQFNSSVFYACRLIVIAAILYAAYVLRGAYFSRVAAYLAVIGGIFFLHNSLVRPRWRIATFISLNTLKILVRLGIIAPAAVMYVCGALPHLAVKLLHYLGTKKIFPISEDMVKSAVLPIYLGCLPVLVLVEPKLILFGVPYFLNHFKSQLFSGAQRLVAGVRA
ncbi:MAG: hypothetical protein J0I19_14155 [Alphaproteobacteria bacterium]|nr:hypothetical protein [Alphaproteobacteria bacterium]